MSCWISRKQVPRGHPMNHELIFSLAGLMAMAGWATLLLSPLIQIWSDWIASLVLPGILCVDLPARAADQSSAGEGQDIGGKFPVTAQHLPSHVLPASPLHRGTAHKVPRFPASVGQDSCRSRGDPRSHRDSRVWTRYSIACRGAAGIATVGYRSRRRNAGVGSWRHEAVHPRIAEC